MASLPGRVAKNEHGQFVPIATQQDSEHNIILVAEPVRVLVARPSCLSQEQQQQQQQQQLRGSEILQQRFQAELQQLQQRPVRSRRALRDLLQRQRLAAWLEQL